jgi:predicted acetyltransferase
VTPQVEVIVAALADKDVMRHLLELYVYDFTEFTTDDVDESGLFGYRYVDQYWNEPDRHPFLIRADGRLAGLALVRSGDPHDMAEFFVMRKYRGRGVGLIAARSLLARFPGEWQVRQMRANAVATAFWRNAIPVPYRDDANETGPVQRFLIAGDPTER